MPKKTNSLTRGQFYRVCEALKEQAKEIEEKQLTYKKIGQILAEKVGFGITEEQIRKAAKLTGICWSIKRSRSVATYHSSRKRLEEESNKLVEIGEHLKLEVAKQDEKLKKLKKLIDHLYNELNEKLPMFEDGPVEVRNRIKENGELSVSL